MEADPDTGRLRTVSHTVDPALVRQFVHDTVEKFGGATQANPLAAVPYRGLWQAQPGSVSIDYLTYLFGLVRMDRSEEALEHFGAWKGKLEAALRQDLILIVYFPVHTIGDL